MISTDVTFFEPIPYYLTREKSRDENIIESPVSVPILNSIKTQEFCEQELVEETIVKIGNADPRDTVSKTDNSHNQLSDS